MKQIDVCKNSVPASLRICNTFFTQMIIVGCFKSEGGFIPLHLDNDDHVTSLLSLGQDVEESGGRTYYVEKHPPKKSSGSKISL